MLSSRKGKGKTPSYYEVLHENLQEGTLEMENYSAERRRFEARLATISPARSKRHFQLMHVAMTRKGSHLTSLFLYIRR